jgi:hypothetical protein
LTAGNKSWFYTVRIQRATIINGFNIYCSSGSDPIRCSVYRNFIRGFPSSNATLVGQSVSISTALFTGLPFLSAPITAVSGQNLNFTAGEYMIIGFATQGGTNTFFSSAALGTHLLDMAFSSTTTSFVANGFPATLTTSSQSSSLLTKICMELY